MQRLYCSWRVETRSVLVFVEEGTPFSKDTSSCVDINLQKIGNSYGSVFFTDDQKPFVRVMYKCVRMSFLLHTPPIMSSRAGYDQ